MDSTVTVGVIGGSGFYDLGADTSPVRVATPWGEAEAHIGDLAGVPVAFVPRHGAGHTLPPHRVEYRANLWALRCLGVAHVVASFACGSLVGEWGPGTLVVPDQLIDRTRGRADTIYDSFEEGPAHAPFADPYAPAVRAALLAAASERGEPAADGATVVVIDGPRFATRAESRLYRSWGADVINMTQYPETVLATELGLSYGAVGLVTDFDAGLEDRPDVAAVTQEAVFEEFARHLPRLRAVVLDAARGLAAG
ncbi:MAG TPA: MTAP family purine nucleoside phosphorylase [Acidimicrobiales bacterium]|nr:MTAP family purine nucleoside phosphorylase [Acidimicrobiales bacterium]